MVRLYILVYPNPFVDDLYVNIGSDDVNAAFIKMYNTNGKLVLARILPIIGQTVKIEASFLTAGVYHVILKTENSGHNFKVVER